MGALGNILSDTTVQTNKAKCMFSFTIQEAKARVLRSLQLHNIHNFNYNGRIFMYFTVIKPFLGKNYL